MMVTFIRPPGIAEVAPVTLAGTSATYHVSRWLKYGYDRANNKMSWMDRDVRFTPPAAKLMQRHEPARGAHCVRQFCRVAKSRRLSSSRRADDNVKSRRQARPCAPRARYTSNGHGTTADNGTCNLRSKLRLGPPLCVRLGAGERRNQRHDDRDHE